MNTHSRKTRLLVVAVVVATVVSIAGPAGVVAGSNAPPQPPHRYYGTVSSGDAGVSGATVTVTYDGETLATTTTDSDGSYSVEVSNEDSDLSEGDQVTVSAQGESKTVTWEPAGATEVDFTTDGGTGSPDDGTDGGDSGDGATGGGGGGGGGGGAAPSGSPDFRTTDADVNRTSMTVGKTLSIEATVENQGDGYGRYEVDLYRNDSFVQSRYVELSAGEEKTFSFERSPSSAGTYQYRVESIVAGVVTVESGDTPTSTDSGVTPTSTDSGVTPTSTDSGVTPTSTDSGVTPTSTDSGVTPTSTDSGATDTPTGLPGFGPVVAIIALLATALLAVRRGS
jgi:PGF-CTERM protein